MAVAAVAVAASGGRDSTALLHATARAARGTGVRVVALHVHHGLMPDADGWERGLRAQVGRWARAGLPVAFDSRRLAAAPARGDSVEAWARRERYRALAEMAQAHGCTLVLLAHHRRDQAETVLLQALRGGGPAGLAAMPKSVERAGIAWARPWLDAPREAIEAYVRRHRLRHVDDASNADARYARSRLRGAVWPALTAAFPDAEATLCAAAARAAEAAACLSELAAGDLAAAVVDDALDVGRWLALSPARRTLLLRTWLGGPETLVQRLAAELPASRIAAWPAPEGTLRLHDGRLRRVADDPAPPARAPSSVDLSRPGAHELPGWGGAIVVEPTSAGGVVPARLRNITPRLRAGGESFQLRPGAYARSLKKQYQARRVPAWERDGPLLYAGDRLLFAAGLGVDARWHAPAGEPQLGLRWVPRQGD